ncbi:MAG: phosphoadenosine phosphosulfate reductase family protein [Oscillospiraceae bacterium]
MKHEIWELKQMQSMPLDIKIKMTETRIRDWYEYWGGEVYVSFSGGKDSTVLLDIVRRLYPDVEAVFVNTGLEYPEIQSFVRTFDNVRILYPKKTFSEVITEYGYPILSKEISNALYFAKKLPDGKCAKRSFYSPSSKYHDYSRFIPVLSMDFNASSVCCNVLKKSPSHLFSKESGKKAITAQMASESFLRLQTWLSHGCNSFDSKNPVSNPMSFWTEQDVLLYIKERGLQICSVYGDIIPASEQISLFPDERFKCSGCERTGCIFCGFGCQYDIGETRFQRLKRTHLKQYNYCIGGGQYNESGFWIPSKEGLGLGHVFDDLNKVYGDNFIRYE